MPPGARVNFFPPEQFGISPEDLKEIFFPSLDGTKLQAYLVKSETRSETSPTILFFHGNAGNISFRLPNISQLRKKLNCNVFILSYRGYGKSEGTPSESGIKLDAQAALNYLLSLPDIDQDQIVLFGRSLGGAVAADLASKNEGKVKGLIIENTFTSIVDMLDAKFPFLSYFKFLCKIEWATERIIGNVKSPVLLLAGELDSLVPVSQMERLRDVALKSSVKVTWYSFPEGDHMDTWSQPDYYTPWKDFFTHIFDQ